MDSNFIDHFDPTAPLDLSGVSISQQYSKLSEKDKLLVGCKLLGMNHVPVPIKTFLFDDYFLGSEEITNHGKSIFPFWIDKLETIFPNPIQTKYPYLSFTGCVGSGKSYQSKMIGLYYLHRLDCCINAHRSLGIAPGAKLAIAFFHSSADTADRDFVRVYKEIFQTSPYFKNLYNKPNIRLIASGPKSTGSVIGSQLIFTVLSEIGFWKPQDAVSKINEVIVRYNSRFANKRFTFGGVIADSSAKDANHGASQKFEESIPAQELYRISPSHWEVRPELYLESKGQTFDFYRGDSITLPHCLENDEDTSKLDKDRIIKVPLQSKFMFINDPVRSLQDLAGYGYTGTEAFFNGNLSHLVKCSSLVNNSPEVISDIDFYDLGDTIYDRVLSSLTGIPKHVSLFIHCDIGLKHDVCGISLCYFTGEKVFEETSYPCFRIPLCFGLSRKKGQSTSLDHIFQFIQRLSQDWSIQVSADSFASSGLFQSLDRVGIPYKTVSVDRTTEPYFFFKNTVNSERIELPYNNRLLRECSELKLVTYGEHLKVDHPEVSGCYEFDYKNVTGAQPGTKDLADAVVGSLWSCYQGYSQYLEDGGTGVRKQLHAMTSLTSDAREEAYKTIQDMIESIY